MLLTMVEMVVFGLGSASETAYYPQ